ARHAEAYDDKAVDPKPRPGPENEREQARDEKDQTENQQEHAVKASYQWRHVEVRWIEQEKGKRNPGGDEIEQAEEAAVDLEPQDDFGRLSRGVGGVFGCHGMLCCQGFMAGCGDFILQW